MLTLTRKVGEIIRIGDDIQVVVKEIRRNHVRIGLLAPKSVKLYRGEVYAKMQAGQAQPTQVVGRVLDPQAVQEALAAGTRMIQYGKEEVLERRSFQGESLAGAARRAGVEEAQAERDRRPLAGPGTSFRRTRRTP